MKDKDQPFLTFKKSLKNPPSLPWFLMIVVIKDLIDPIKVDFALAVFLERCRNQFASIRLAKQIIGLAFRSFSFGTF